MSFTTIYPPARRKAAGEVRVTAYVQRLKGGEVRCTVNLSTALALKLNGAKHATVKVGDAEHRGMLRIEFGQAGEFQLGKISPQGGHGRLVLPELDVLPRQTVKSAECQIKTFSDGVLVIRLPLEAWTQANVRSVRPAA